MRLNRNMFNYLKKKVPHCSLKVIQQINVYLKEYAEYCLK